MQELRHQPALADACLALDRDQQDTLLTGPPGIFQESEFRLTAQERNIYVLRLSRSQRWKCLREELLHRRVLKDTAVQFLGFRHGTRSQRLGERPGAALEDVECLVLPTERIATQHRLTVCLLAGRIMCNGLFAEV